MAKRTRDDHGTRLLHVIGRCVHDDELFPSDFYARLFWGEIGGRSLEFGVDILSVCLLRNHYHLIVRGQPDALADTMHRGLSKLANVRNRIEERRRGALVGRRYDVIPVQDGRHAANLIRYVPMNPVLHRLARDPADWRWSTHAILIGRRPCPEWFDRRKALSAFGFHDAAAYERFVLAGTPLYRPPVNPREVREHRVLVMAEAGVGLSAIRDAVGLSERHVRRIIASSALLAPEL